MSAVHPLLPEIPRRQLAEGLRPFWRRSICLATIRVTLWTLAGLLLALLAAMWLDLVWALPSAVRWWVSRGGPLLAGLLAVAWGIHLIRKTDHDRLSARIDRRQSTGGEILAGWQLSSRAVRPSGALSEGLAAMAVDRASGLLRGFAPADVFPWSRLRRAVQTCGGIVLVVGLLAAAMPSVAGTQLRRFLTPAADVPPFTGLRIELELDETTVLYGQDVMVTAKVSSDAVSKMQLVSVTDDGIENVLPMLPGRKADAAADGQQWQTLLTRVTEPLRLHARSGPSRSRFHRLDVQMTPEILPPTVRITPPAYTGAGTYEGPIPRDGLSGLAGTEVQWQVKSNRPLSKGRLRLQYRDDSREEVLLKPADERAGEDAVRSTGATDQTPPVLGSMQLSRPGRFELSVVDIEGIESQQRVEGTITILQDQRPVVRIASPRPMSLATPDIELPVVISAEDDYGITRLSLYRSLNGSPARKVDLQVDSSSRQNVEMQLPLNRYSLRPGDEIQLFARVEDNDPAGAKGAESPVTTVRIISAQEFQEMAIRRQGAESLQAKYEEARRHFESLAETLRQAREAAGDAAESPESSAATEALREKLQEAREKADEAAKAIEKLSQQAMPIDVDQQLAKQLEEQAALAEQMARELEEMTTPSSESQEPLSEQQQMRLEQLAEQAAENRQQLQDQAVDPLRTMQEILPLLVDQQRFAQITAQQRDLAQRLNSLRDSADPDDEETQRRIADLESEQQQWREALDELLDDIQTHAEQLPQDPELEKLRQTAEEFVEAVRSSDALPLMASAQQHLIDGALERGRDDASEAADILESFLSQCDALGDQACESCEAAFNPSAGGPQLGDSLQQMLNMMGMKPGSSGAGPGMGFGAAGGFAQRFPGPENVGMYGSLPTPAAAAQGQGDQTSGGVASRNVRGVPGGGSASVETEISTAAGGQADQAIPRQYRSQVTEYFRRLTEEMPD